MFGTHYCCYDDLGTVLVGLCSLGQHWERNLVRRRGKDREVAADLAVWVAAGWAASVAAVG